MKGPGSFLYFFYIKMTEDLGTSLPRGGGGADLVLTLPGCVCPKVKDMGPFLASRE